MLPETWPEETDLAAGTQLLRGQYQIECPLSKGGFGITYLARDSLNRKVVIKECFPQDLCVRQGVLVAPTDPRFATEFGRILARFKREALRLAALDHPRVVGVHQVFEENGTAFLAMDHIVGDDLFDIFENGLDRLDAASLHHLLTDALQAVAYVHSEGMLHRDLAPDNFILGVDGHITLIDFGSACGAVTDGQADEDAKLLAVKDGYSPYEFYTGEGQGFSSDLYALAATFYFLVTGDAPPASHSRASAAAGGLPDPFTPLMAAHWGLSEAFVAPINQALALDPAQRLQSASDWLALMENAQPASATPNETVIAPVPAHMDSPAHYIDAAIAQLVSDTNSDLMPRAPGSDSKRPRTRAMDAAPKAQADAPKQLVDIFGNPVDDVETFLREQDKSLAKRRAKPDTAPQAAEHQPKQSALGRILGKLRPGAKPLKPAVPQN